MSQSVSRRMVFVDGLRGLAAVAIVFTHSNDLFRAVTNHGAAFAILLGNARFYAIESVQIFFVLSGFVIAYTMRDARLTPPVWGRFILRRAVRLDPPYWLSILFSSAVLVIRADAGHRLAAVPSLRLVLAHLLYLQDIFGFGEPINHIFWTLCIEMQMYIAFSGSICILQAMRVPYRPVLTVGLILSLGWPLGLFWQPPWRFFLGQEYCFLAGAVAWWGTEKSVPRWMLLAAVGAFLCLSVSRVGDYHTWTTFITALVLVIAGNLGTLHTWLGSRPFQFLGGISYGLYLVHDPIIQLTVPVQLWFGLLSTANSFVVLAFVYAICFAAAYAIRRWVEIPSIKLSHYLKVRNTV